MSSVSSAGLSSFNQKSSASEVLREPGKMGNRSVAAFSKQPSEKGGTEAQSFITKVVSVILSVIILIWDGLKSLFREATPESSNATLASSKITPKPSQTTPEPSKTTPKPSQTTPEPSKTTPKPSQTTPEPSQTTPKPSQTTPEPSKTTFVFSEATKDSTPTVRAATKSFCELLKISIGALDKWDNRLARSYETRIRAACDLLPPLLQQKLYRSLNISDTGPLKVDSYENLQEIQRLFRLIKEELPSLELVRLEQLFNNRSTDKARARILLQVGEIKLSELDPDVTVEILKKSMLDLFERLDESVKSSIYTEVYNAVGEERGSSIVLDSQTAVNGGCGSIQPESMGKMIVETDPCGVEVQAGIRKCLL